MTIGQDVPIVLKFADGKTMTAQFRVEGPSGQ
jgi:hypothetical protein